MNVPFRSTSGQRLTAAGAICIAAAATASPAMASSHREAPSIAGSPRLDATDFYMFRSYEAGRDGFVTLIANYQPFQTSYGGPNFFPMDPNALYQIHIDNNGDGQEDVTFTFRFSQAIRGTALTIGSESVPVPLVNTGQIGPFVFNRENANQLESFTVDVTFGDRFTGQSAALTQFGDSRVSAFRKPVDFIGRKSFVAGNYEPYALRHIYKVNLPGARAPARVFVGQRKDPFVVNLGEVFDLVNLDPLGDPAGKADTLAFNNVTTLAIEIPINYLVGSSTSSAPMDPVLGAWTTCSVPQNRSLTTTPTYDQPNTQSGAFVQVSRLGHPLVNELVIGLPDKDLFNASSPSGDGQFLRYVTNPTLPALLGSLFGVTPPTLPRNDLVQVFLTGVPGLTQPANGTPAEILRLNTSIAVQPRGSQNPLGVLGGDTAGFPNGRRPGDDVVDISLRAVMGALYPDAGQSGGNAPQGNLPFTDQAFIDDSFFYNAFPYLTVPVTSSPNNFPTP